MTVEKSELESLQKYINSQISRINASSQPDTARLFDLNIVDSNLSLLLFGVEEGELVELGTSDKAVKKFLKEYREKRSVKESAEIRIDESSDFAADLITLLNRQIEDTQDWENRKLAENIEQRYKGAIELLSEIQELSGSTKKEKKRWSTENIPTVLESKAEKSAGAVLGSIRSEKKALASRENGKKGGRPKKQPQK